MMNLSTDISAMGLSPETCRALGEVGITSVETLLMARTAVLLPCYDELQNCLVKIGRTVTASDPITCLCMTMRTTGCLECRGVNTVGDLLSAALANIKDLRSRELEEAEECISKLDLRFLERESA